jgi:hypothetical protein
MIEPEGRRGLGGNLILPIAGIIVLVVIVAIVAVVCTGGGSDDDTPEVTPTLEPTPTVAAGSQQESAIVQYVATTRESEYAGNCDDADTTTDVGKVCSIYRGEREGVHAFVLGETFSEAFEWAFVQMQGGTWRVTETTPITAENAGVPGIPWPLHIGAEVVVIGTGSCLNVRTEPGGAAVDCITEGTPIILAAGPEEARDLQWWQVEGRDGWVAADYLRYPDATIDPEPTPAPQPTQEESTPEATETP